MSRMLNLSWMAWSRARVAAVIDPATARRQLEQILAMADLPEGQLADAHRTLAGLLLRSARYPEARRHLAASIRLEPTATTCRRLAQAWEDDPYGDDRRAAGAYRRATRLDPSDAIAWAALGRAAVRCGLDRVANRALRRAVRLAPANAEVLAIVIDGLRESGRLATAQRILSQARFREPQSTAIRDLINRVRYEMVRTRYNTCAIENSTSTNLLPFVRIVGSDGERRVIRRDNASRPAPVSLRLRG